MSFEEQIRESCESLPRERLQIVGLERFNTETIGRGVLFVFATWSAESVHSFRLLCRAITQAGASDLRVFVIDADGFDLDTFQEHFGELPQGKGEAYWIKNDQVLFRDHGYAENTESVLLERVKQFGQ